MTLKADIKGHWSLFDGVAEVTLVRLHPTAADVGGVKALKRQISLGKLAYLGGTLGINPKSVTWHLWEDPALTAAAAKVGPGDKVVEADGTTWIIDAPTYSDQTSRYQCLCSPVR